ncbi:hypothetical protein ACFFS2_32540 [Streptomyces aurantiacus]|uniref:Uncharacterized protein n=1 Tax=Streptomyces aurantiacus TaxID=47760 RepID=A0A7G1NX32_9ACTN|nr:hypothetical protein [Streptomyces aurantiacus]BCL27698.1 hypothetical protein GCM10017557_25570 [Streptomyces aurantiacus]
MTAATSCVHDEADVNDVNDVTDVTDVHGPDNAGDVKIVRCAANGARVFEEAC